MTWTSARPTEPGLYWLRAWDDRIGGPGKPEAVTVADIGLLWAWVVGRQFPVHSVDPRSLWAGPVVPPVWEDTPWPDAGRSATTGTFSAPACRVGGERSATRC